MACKATDFLDISFSEAQELSSKNQKHIFLYFTAKWCGPCKVMERAVFTNDTVSNNLRENFIALKIDGDSWAGEKLVKEFKVAGYPTLLIVDAKKNVLKRNFGRMSVNDLLTFIKMDYGSVGIIADVSQREQKQLEWKSKMLSSFRPEVGVRIGMVRSTISNYTSESRIGYDVGFFIAMEKGRWLVRPGVNFVSKGGKTNGITIGLNYIQLPVDFSLSFYKSAIFTLPGGIRLVGSPYYAMLVNDNDFDNYKRSDYGVRTGLGVYIGETSKLELLLLSEFGFAHVTDDRVQRNQCISFTVLFTR